jgi:hypothetical protein
MSTSKTRAIMRKHRQEKRRAMLTKEEAQTAPGIAFITFGGDFEERIFEHAKRNMQSRRQSRFIRKILGDKRKHQKEIDSQKIENTKAQNSFSNRMKAKAERVKQKAGRLMAHQNQRGE